MAVLLLLLLAFNLFGRVTVKKKPSILFQQASLTATG
jgi:hypothetical protein